MNLSRRYFLQASTVAAGGLLVPGPSRSAFAFKEQKFKISLAQWSLNEEFFKGELDNLDFAKTAKQEFGIDGIEYVNQFFKDKAKDKQYLKEMKSRADGEGVNSLLIMID